MYFLFGVLPWQKLKVKKNEDKIEKIAEKKYNTTFEELTKNQPEEFLMFFKYIDRLNFKDQPDYIYLIGLFQTMIDKYCRDCFYDFDWKKDSFKYAPRDIKNNEKLDLNFKSSCVFLNDKNEDNSDNKEGKVKKPNKKQNDNNNKNINSQFLQKQNQIENKNNIIKINYDKEKDDQIKELKLKLKEEKEINSKLKNENNELKKTIKSNKATK